MRSDDEETIARVAALDIGKAELVCCVRVPGAGCLEETITGGLDPFDDDQVVGRSGESPGRPACRASGDGGDLRLLAAGVLHAGGPWQLLVGGHHGVEQQPLVLTAHVQLAGHPGRAARTSSPSTVWVRGKVPSSTPTRQTTRWGTERIGTIVQTVSSPAWRNFARAKAEARRPRLSCSISGADN